jgi:hypothetical protein
MGELVLPIFWDIVVISKVTKVLVSELEHMLYFLISFLVFDLDCIHSGCFKIADWLKHAYEIENDLIFSQLHLK